MRTHYILYMRNLIESQCEFWRAGVAWSLVPGIHFQKQVWTIFRARFSGSIVAYGRPARKELQYSSMAVTKADMSDVTAVQRMDSTDFRLNNDTYILYRVRQREI